jgi:hypothetical protein
MLPGSPVFSSDDSLDLELGNNWRLEGIIKDSSTAVAGGLVPESGNDAMPGTAHRVRCKAPSNQDSTGKTFNARALNWYCR